MDLGDILYYIVVVFFLILGVFNNIRKQKNKQATVPAPRHDYEEETVSGDEPSSLPWETVHREMPPPVVLEEKKRVREFQSSVVLVTDFDKELSLESAPFMGEEGIRSVFLENEKAVSTKAVHPLVKDLHKADKQQTELQKAIVYAAVFGKKW